MAGKEFAQHLLGFGQCLIKSRLLTLVFILGTATVLLGSAAGVSAQPSGGDDSPKKVETGDKADQNLKSLARVNPSTLAMEMSLPLMTYPGRNGNSLPVGLTYSSKVWGMKAAHTWWYPAAHGDDRKYVTDLNAIYGERTAAGWTSNLTPPRIDSDFELYNVHGQSYGNSVDYAEISGFFSTTIQGIGQENFVPPFQFSCGAVCDFSVTTTESGYSCRSWHFFRCLGSYDDVDPTTGPVTPNYLYYVRRLRVAMPSGGSTEFRNSDADIYCGTILNGCSSNWNGMYLAVDGSGAKLDYTEENGSTLYMPDGSRYIFPAIPQGGNGLFATEFIDAKGNRLTFTAELNQQTGETERKWTDTLGRVITDPVPHNWLTQTQKAETKHVYLPGLDGQTPLHYQVKWSHLKPLGCEEDTTGTCTGGTNNQNGDALENQAEKLFFDTRYLCQGSARTDLLANPSNLNDPANEVLFLQMDFGIRPCNAADVVRDSNGNPTQQLSAVRFNPTVLREVVLPNGRKYEFKYNRFGEITKIVYPSGSYETFKYEWIAPIRATALSPYDQTNRGVTERRVYNADGTLEQRWQYSAALTGTYPNFAYKVTTIAPKHDNALGNGVKTERFLHTLSSSFANFGFDSPLNGMPKEEKAYDEAGVLRSRTLTEWMVKGAIPSGNQYNPENSSAMRDPRVKQSVSVIFENGKALATLSKTEYDENGSADPEHFSHLNVKRKKGYHYKALDLSTAQTGSLETIAGQFSDSTDLAAVSETDYLYNANYKARGIHSLPVETRAMNPANTSEVLAKSQVVYDNLIPSQDSDYPYTTQNYSGINSLHCPTATNATQICWQSPNTYYVGNPTTSRIWDKDNNTWIETHTRYDIFGNAVQAKDPLGNETTTEFHPDYKYAYPTKVIAPAPDPTGIHGSSETSQAITTYDFSTGLPLTVTDDLSRTTKTEYDDALLRPTKVSGVGNFIIPVTLTFYDDIPATETGSTADGDSISVTVKKQIDENNWDEATTYFDSLGRATKTQAKDSQGDVLVETKYDKLGRVQMITNPYRAGDDLLWNLTEYDAVGRVKKTRAPMANQNPANPTGDILGVTSFDISIVTGYVGTVTVTTDASGRKSRSITNALGQLVRVDEPTATGGSEITDLGSLDNPHQPTYYKYDYYGKMVRVQQGKTGEAAIQNRYFLYDSLGRLIRVRQPEQEVNQSLNTTQSIDGNTQWTAGFVYDVLGNVKRATNANGTNIINEYDKASRITKRCYTKQNINTSATECSQISGNDLDLNTPAIEHFYDGKGVWTDQQLQQAPYKYSKGKLTKVTSSISETRYTLFDQLGRLTQSQQITSGQTYTSGYEYNLSGALIKEIYPSGREVKNEFESDGDLRRIFGRASQNAAERTYANGFSYTPDGRIQRLRLGNNRWESAKFNDRLQVMELALGNSDGDGSLWKLNYEHGELQANGSVDASKNTGNIARQTLSFNGLTQPLVQSYKYDSLYRLTEAKETNGSNQNWIQTFGYDRFGNRTSFSQNGNGLNTSQTPTIDPNTNRLVTTGQNFVYDKNGNLTTDGDNRTFIFNGDNKQREVKNAGGITIGRYFYDGEGKRVKKKTFDPLTGQETEETVFVYSAGKLVAEYSTAAPPPAPTTSYTATDMLGSPRVITDADGQVKSRRDFMPFGEELNPDNNYRKSNEFKYGQTDSVRQRFTGYQKDAETNLDFAEARMYENRHGRFTAVDPLLASGKSANPQTFNRFVYVMNNPIVFTDPSGLQVAQPFCTDCQPAIQGSGENETLAVFKKGEKLPAGFNPITQPRVFNGQSGRSYYLTPTSSQSYTPPPPASETTSETPSQSSIPGNFNGRFSGFQPCGIFDFISPITPALRGLETLTNKDILPDATSLNVGVLGFGGHVKITRDGNLIWGGNGDVGETMTSLVRAGSVLADVDSFTPGKEAPDLRKAFKNLFNISVSNEFIMTQARNPFSASRGLNQDERLDVLTGPSYGAGGGKYVTVGGEISPTPRGNYYTQKFGLGGGISGGVSKSWDSGYKIPFLRW